MRLTRQTKKPGRIELNMASMIDVVFLLLIFFMCTSANPEVEHEMKTQMPQVSGGTPEDEPFEPIRIRLSAPEGKLRLTCDGQACVDADGAASFEVLTAELKKRRAIPDPAIAELRVVIEGEPEVAFGRMVAALSACHEADLHRTVFSARGTDP